MERRPSEAFPVFGGAAGTASTEPLPLILTKAAAVCFVCWIAVSGRSLSPPFQGGSPNALNKCQVCHSGYWTVDMHIDVLYIVGASELLYCSQRAWRRLSSPRLSPAAEEQH